MRQLPGYLILFLIIAFGMRIDFAFYIIYLCVGVYAWSMWYPGYALQRLLVERDYARRAFLGEYVPVTLRITNAQRLPVPWLQFRESLPLRLRADNNRAQAITLAGRGETTFQYRIWTTRRGYYRIGPLSLGVGDLFGFREQSGRTPVDYLTIYPRILPLNQLGLPSRLPFGTLASHQRIFEDPARPMGVRDYRAGDSLRRINWKASAHKDGLLVKTLEPAISLETFVLLNLDLDDYSRRNRYDGPEWSIVVAASLAAHLTELRQSVGLSANGTDPLANQAGDTLDFDEESGRLLYTNATDEGMPTPIPPRRGRANLMKILESLARMEGSERGQTFARWVTQATVGLGFGTTVLIITPKGDEAICQAGLRLVKSGFNPVLLVTEPQANMGRLMERARRLGFRAYGIANEREIKTWQQAPRG